jgi:hypothetical protein
MLYQIEDRLVLCKGGAEYGDEKTGKSTERVGKYI